MATMTPAIGDAARPMLAANCKGSINEKTGNQAEWLYPAIKDQMKKRLHCHFPSAWQLQK